MNDNIKPQIKRFLLQHIRANTLGDDDDIFSRGFVNSLFAMRLVTFIENVFSLTVENHELSIENFNTVNNIAAYVAQKTNQ
ncbi:acyl carrier protein [Microbulbifer sp. SSSA002]|uniref:acyl carrier protein n=1 Tax=Microbulbifer sp. SSSA002 TaxID=3243376 RepID=UPI004039FDD2